jgi:hypothetical protein
MIWKTEESKLNGVSGGAVKSWGGKGEIETWTVLHCHRISYETGVEEKR